MRRKWLILALHNALQGACTCALWGKDSVGISMLTEKSAKEVWHWLEAERREKMPEPRLAPFARPLQTSEARNTSKNPTGFRPPSR
jgi:hypothetical protein